jgi:hypothetical protein
MYTSTVCNNFGAILTNKGPSEIKLPTFNSKRVIRWLDQHLSVFGKFSQLDSASNDVINAISQIEKKILGVSDNE